MTSFRFVRLQLADRISTITGGVLFSSWAVVSFEPLAQRVVFGIQKEGAAATLRPPPVIDKAALPLQILLRLLAEHMGHIAAEDH